MEKESIDKKSRFNSVKKLILILLCFFVLSVMVTGGYFLYKHLFPTDKELLIQANLNTILKNQSEKTPEVFNKNSKITFSAEGGFSNQKAADAFETFVIETDNICVSDDKTKYDMSIEFLGQDFFTSTSVKVDGTEVFAVPQLAEKSYGADSYRDVLSVLLGSDRGEDISIYDGVDREGFKVYYADYLKEIYQRIPDKDFVVTESGNVKTVTLNTNLNMLLYDVLVDIKADKELRDFTYDQTCIVYENINKNFPYMGTLMTVQEKDKYDEEFETSINEFIEDIENSTVKITARIDKNRNLISEIIEVADENEIQFLLEYAQGTFKLLNVDDGEKKLDLSILTEERGTVTKKDTILTLDINDYTKEKSEEQKNVTMHITSTTDTDVDADIVLPAEYGDIRKMSEEEKTNITQTASKKFMEMVATLTLELIF